LDWVELSGHGATVSRHCSRGLRWAEENEVGRDRKSHLKASLAERARMVASSGLLAGKPTSSTPEDNL
jgi:hypothetical protein